MALPLSHSNSISPPTHYNSTHLVFICEICRNQLQLFQFCTLKSIKHLLQAGFQVMAAWLTNRDTLIFVVNCTFFLHERSNCNRGMVQYNESRTWWFISSTKKIAWHDNLLRFNLNPGSKVVPIDDKEVDTHISWPITQGSLSEYWKRIDCG